VDHLGLLQRHIGQGRRGSGLAGGWGGAGQRGLGWGLSRGG
jgi:hypothetical protein